MTRLSHPIARATDAPGSHWPGVVVCGVDGTALAREAVRQAVEVAGPRGRVELVAVSPPSNRAAFPPVPEAAVAEAERAARALGANVTSKHVTAPTPSYGLIRAARHADLLVIGCDALGWVPTAVLRRAPCPVLLARRPPDRPLLDTVLVGCGSAPIAHARAAALAAAHGSELSSVRAETITTAAAAIGAGLIVLADDGDAPHQARIAPCSVLVVRDRH